MASTSGTQKPSWSEAHHEDVGRPEVGLELGAGDRAGQRDRVGQPEVVDEGRQRRLVGLAQRRADQVQAGRRVVEAPVARRAS